MRKQSLKQNAIKFTSHCEIFLQLQQKFYSIVSIVERHPMISTDTFYNIIKQK